MKTFLISFLFLILFFQNVLPDVPQEIQNLRTFTKIYGYVRFFHPSDEASNLDWDKFGIYGISQVRKAKNNSELKSTLEQLFYPVAPTMEIYNEGDKPEALKFPSDATGLKTVAWQHYGFSTNLPWRKGNNIYRSIRTNRKTEGAESENSSTTILQMIDATALKGKKIIFKADLNLVEDDSAAVAFIWITNYNLKNRESYSSNMKIDTVKLIGWSKHELPILINENSTSISFGCVLEGNGKLLADNFEIFIQDSIRQKNFKIENSGFEEVKENGEPKNWYVYGIQYNIKSSDVKPYTGQYSLLIESKKNMITGQIFEQLPKIGEVINKPIGSGLYCQIPLALYSDENSTLGKRKDYLIDSLISKISIIGAGNNYGFGTATNGIDAEKYRGKDIKLKAAVKTKVEGKGNQCQLWLRVDKTDGNYGFFNNMDDRPIKNPEWNEYEIIGKVDEDAERVVFGGMLIGEGNVWLDDFQLFFKNDEGGWESIEIPNNDFEEGEKGEKPTKWRTDSPGYLFKLTDETPYKGNQCLMLELQTTKNNNMTDERLASAIIAWNVFQHFFPYMDVVNVDWETELTNTLKETISDKTDFDFYNTLCKMTAKLQDGHINVNSKMTWNFARLPFQAAWVENQVVVTATGDSTKFQVGDIIEKIDDKSAEEELLSKEQLISAAPQFRRWKCLGWGYFGIDTAGSTAKMQIKRGNQNIEVTEERHLGIRDYIDDITRGSIEDLGNNIYYVRMDSITLDEFNSRINDLAKAKGIIFEMRGYPKEISLELISHLIDKEVNSPNWLVPQIIYPDRENMTWDKSNWQVYPINPRFKGKIIFLTDGRAISAAETFMGIIENYKLGEIIGEATAGTNGNINYIMLPGGINVTFTGMKVLKHDGSQHHLIGIQPTIPVKRTIKGIREGRDEYLDKALEILGVGLNIDTPPTIYK